MLPKKWRFTTRGFDFVFRKGQKIRTQSFMFRVSRDRFGRGKFGVVVSKKHVKLATRRNRLRRQIYEIWRTRFAAKFGGQNVICHYFGETGADVSRDFAAAVQSQLERKNRF